VGGGPDGQSPIFVAKGTMCPFSIHAMHRREDLWGPDAGLFRPERWDADKAIHTWDYLPFNGGPRICLGRK
jgi:cytochrome P450